MTGESSRFSFWGNPNIFPSQNHYFFDTAFFWTTQFEKSPPKARKKSGIYHDGRRKSPDANMDTSSSSSTAARDRDEWSWQHLRSNNGGLPSVLSAFRKIRLGNIQDSSTVGGWVKHHRQNVGRRRKPPRWSGMINPVWRPLRKLISMSLSAYLSKVTDR